VIASLLLRQDLRAQIAREANAALPRECCGLIEGSREGARVVATALHPTHNIATDDDRFEIDPAAHIALLKKLRGTDRAIVGCYHSHPNGRAAPSPRDGGGETGFIWLIAATRPHGAVSCAAHLREGDLWHALAIQMPEPVA
jgi:proteasome lid subunit RPN8/RPN11